LKTVFSFFFLLFFVSEISFSQNKKENRYDDYFRKYSKRFFGIGFDWKVFKAQGLAESGLMPDARSWVGAIGIMQLMPSTFKDIQSSLPELQNVNDPQWNIAAGILYDRQLWKAWSEHETTDERLKFIFGSYNAGKFTITKAQQVAQKENLDHRYWNNIETIAPKVQQWRHDETLNYVRKIENYYSALSKRNGFTDFLGK